MMHLILLGDILFQKQFSVFNRNGMHNDVDYYHAFV